MPDPHAEFRRFLDGVTADDFRQAQIDAAGVSLRTLLEVEISTVRDLNRRLKRLYGPIPGLDDEDGEDSDA